MKQTKVLLVSGTRQLYKYIYIWVWVNTYRYIFSGMNIHLPAILGFTRYQGFDPYPYKYIEVALIHRVKTCYRSLGVCTLKHAENWNSIWWNNPVSGVHIFRPMAHGRRWSRARKTQGIWVGELYHSPSFGLQDVTYNVRHVHSGGERTRYTCKIWDGV